jgi:hypothetical protein
LDNQLTALGASPASIPGRQTTLRRLNGRVAAAFLLDEVILGSADVLGSLEDPVAASSSRKNVIPHSELEASIKDRCWAGVKAKRGFLRITGGLLGRRGSAQDCTRVDSPSDLDGELDRLGCFQAARRS